MRTTKLCKVCNIEKDSEQFSPSSFKRKYWPVCKSCNSKYYKSYSESEHGKETKEIYCNSTEGRWNAFKKSAKVRGIPISISAEQFESITNSHCYYCGRTSEQMISLNTFILGYNGNNILIKKARKSFATNQLKSKHLGIDRKHSEEGYTLDNSVPCCVICNVTKGWEFNSEEYLLIAKHFINRLVRVMEQEHEI